MVKTGGCVPGLDHRIPNRTPLDNYGFYGIGLADASCPTLSRVKAPGCRGPVVRRIMGPDIGEAPRRRRASGYHVEELAMGWVRLAGGVTLDIIESWAIHLDGFEGSCVVGSRGGIRLRPFSFHCTEADMEMDATFDMAGADRRWHALNDTEAAYDSPQHHWVAALREKVPLLPTAELALLTMLVSEGIYLSDRLGREVTAREVVENSRSTAVQV